MGAKVGRKKGAESDINVTPLIDVVLVLLIIFMVLTPRVVQEMTTNLPSKTETKKKKDNDKKDQLVVAVYEDGKVALNLKYVDDRELFDELRKRLPGKESKVVFVDAHPDLNYERVVKIMDIVKEAGAERVGLARLKDEGPGKPPEAGSGEPAPADGAAG